MRAEVIEMVDEDASAPFCAACGSLVQPARRQDGGRIRPRRKYCERHFRTPPGFNRWVQRLSDAADSAGIVSRWTKHLIELEKARKSFAFDRDAPRLRREAPQRLNSGLRYLAAEFCGAGQGTGKIVDRDVMTWAARLCGATASETAHAVGASRRTVSTSNDKVTRAVARAADLCGDKIAAVRDALLTLASEAGYLSASPASRWDAAELRELAAFIDAQSKMRRASWPRPIDIRPTVEALLKIGLVALITPVALLAASSAAGLPDAAFDPKGFLRRLVRRSRVGKPPELRSVLDAYLLAAKKREHAKLPWDEDPAFVLVTGLSLARIRHQRADRRAWSTGGGFLVSE
ncbi:hypothetical protein [Sinimarinibacterium thermocellulolyticum]|uniref:Uncharacterized protein n=1 Tax=Sinimarinibacterium thermocellulolyticum TaxID=3170016 RepID=A0ABV2A962_9GAMM